MAEIQIARSSLLRYSPLQLKKLKIKYPQKKAVKKTDSIPSLSEDTIIKTPESFVLLEKVPPEVMSSSLSSPSLRRRSSIVS